MAGRLGLCVSARHLPSADELAALRPTFLRSILYADRDLDALLATGLSLRLTINNEWARVGSDWSGWEDASRYLRDRAHGRVLSIDCGNELDRWWALREAERQQAPLLPLDVPPDFGAELVTRAQAILNPAGIAVGTSSLGGPRWPEYLAALLQICRPDHVALNPYGWIFEGIDVKCGASEALAPGLPYWFPELGCKIVDASGEQGVADALVAVAEVLAARGIDAAWFAWHDLLGTPEERGPAAFGLVDVDGRRRPAWHAFATLNAATVPAPEPSPEPPSEPEPEPMPETLTRAQIIDVVQAVADAVGIPRLLLFACGCAESNLGQFSRRPADFADAAKFWPDVSMGAFHQTVRYAPEYLRWCAVDAPGHDPNAFPGLDVVEAVAAHYWDVEHAAQVAASQLKGKYRPGEPDALFRALCRYNWPSGDGRPYSDAHAANYRRGIADATALLNADVPTEPSEPVFDPSHPAHPQEETFDCSQESLEWGFWAYGRTTADDWLESTMLAEGVMSREWGLMDASGAGLAAFVRRHYAELGYTAESADPVTFDAVAAEAGRYPLLIGGRAWYHWSGVRGYDAAADVLLLANPADGHKGVGQTLSRAQWAALGPFSLVRVRHESTAVAQPPAEPDELAVLRARIAEIEAEKVALVEGLAVVGDDYGDQLQALVDAIRKVRAERVGPRPAA